MPLPAPAQELQLLQLSQDGNRLQKWQLQRGAGKNIAAVADMDVLSFMAHMEEAVERKADVVFLPHAILLERENSILHDYLQKLRREQGILFVAPRLRSKRSIFHGWNTVDLDLAGKWNLPGLGMEQERRLGALRELFSRQASQQLYWQRYQIFL